MKKGALRRTLRGALQHCCYGAVQRLAFIMGWELGRWRARGVPSLFLLNGAGQMLGGTRVAGSNAGRMDVREAIVAAW